MNTYSVLFRHVLSVLLFAFSFLAGAQSLPEREARPAGSFNHATTGFQLTGTHLSTQCESCHIQALFKGTPRDCATCHRNGGRAAGKTVAHIPTQEACDTCHRTSTWTATSFKHTAQMSNQCTSCHNGSFVASGASGKPLSHINTTSSCDTCHSSTAWLPATNPHANVTPGSCANCHNGVRAIGKNATHIPTVGACDTCHTNFRAFAPAKMDHTGQTACSSCHSGSFAAQNAQAKPVTHIATPEQCSSCHTSTVTWGGGVNFAHPANAANNCISCHGVVGSAAKNKPVAHLPTTAQCDTCHNNFTTFIAARVNHATLGGTCSGCHDGSPANVAQNARGKGVTHFVTSQSCDDCHITSGWAPASNFAHQGVTAGTCAASCHGGASPVATSKPLSHIPGSGSCDNCHVNYLAFAPAKMSHSGLAGQCSTCHNGSFTAINAQSKASSPTHNPASAQCDTCHQSTTSWATVTYVHAPTDTLCATCHNGTNALGKPSTHIPTTGACSDCHTNKVSFKPAQMLHSTSTVGQCTSCHNGNFKFANALPKPSSHIPVSGECDVCHTQNSAAFAPATMSHSGLTNCSSCHGGLFTAVNAQTKPISHVATALECSTCHASTSNWRGGVSYQHAGSAVNNCSSCHNGSVSGALAKPTSHIPVSGQCDSCHSGYVAFKPASMNHTGLTGRCDSCHGGTYAAVNALPKRAGHVPTTADCVNCHTTGFVSWAGARMNHDAAVVGKCSTCHSGSFLAVNAQSKTPTHIPTTAQCDTCHRSTTTWATGTFAHTAAVAGVCSNCHNGTNALGKSINHIPTSSQCDSCHANFTSFRPASMNHTGLTGQCASCHNGSYVYVNALNKSSGHIPTTAQCDTCHIGNYTSWTPAAMSHAGFSNNCSSCHSGAYLAQNAQIKPVTHVTTTAQCDTCHRSTTSWATATYMHDSGATGKCSTCHNGQLALAKSTQHAPTTAQCDTCHLNFAAFAPAAMNHTGTAGACLTCHTGTFSPAVGKPAMHIPTTAVCDTCHATSAWKPAANFSHTGLTDCAACHNGTNALGKSTRHIPSGSTQCSSCHATGTSFTPATMSHTGMTACTSCHNGTYLSVNAQMKPLTHSATTGECSGCHASRTTWATSTFDHSLASPAATGRCSTCHDGASTSLNKGLSKPSNHIPTTAQCDSCHSGYVAFAPATMNHAGTAALCANCHSGAYTFANAQMKSAKHVVTTAQCDTCHKSTTLWTAAQYVHPTDAAGRCATCHNGTTALGLSVGTHIPVAGTANCDNCHDNFTTFAPARMNHANLSSSCATCHSGSYVAINAQKASATHIPLGAQTCDSCHVNGFVSWTPSVMNHTGLTACSTCHSGGYLAQNAQSKPTWHVSYNAGLECNNSGCHASTVTWATTTFNHTAVTPSVNGRCSTCHDGAASSNRGLSKPVTHVPTTAQCDTCHTGFVSFMPAQMNHSGTTAQCSTCHSGAYVGVNAKAKPATHIVTTQVCDTCHTTTAWKPASNFAHQGVTAGSCANCHNGVNALGKPSKHIPVTSACDSCHKNYVAFAPAQMNHTGLNGQCSTCHSGAYLTINAQTKTATHATTTAQCDVCHASTTTWATATFVHAATDTNCSSCHNGTKALGKPVNHVPTALQCDTCHTYKVAFKPAQMSHASGVAGKCSSCHNGNFTFANALAKPVSHIPVSSECDTCHTRGYISWSPANMNHTGLTACSTCHSGAYLAQNAQIKPATHLVTALQCNSCHNSTVTWASNPKPNHTGYVNNCSTNCHDGNPTHAIGKPVNHVPTTAQCDTCHNTTSFLLTPPMNHAGTAGQCASCHNGSYTTLGAQAKTAKHIPTTQSCDVCHTTSAWRPTSFAHTGVATGTCLTCHNGTNAAGKSVPHVPTTQSCDGCHRINAWMPLVTPYSHTGVAAGTCSTCHINSYPSIDVKPASHIPTTAACDACHTKTAWLPLTKYAHTGVGTGTCQNCHVSPYTSITLMPSNHIPVTLGGMLGRECSLCHTSTTSFMTEKMNHGSVTVCKNCHDRTATYLGTMDKKSVTHDKAGKTDCNNAGCHKPAAGGRGTLFVKW